MRLALSDFIPWPMRGVVQSFDIDLLLQLPFDHSRLLTLVSYYLSSVFLLEKFGTTLCRRLPRGLEY